ncbi:hypothetical protein K505DRAFT_260584 [Melanomma pulvis-pyrius CBS 109.77]|uniref:Cupin type-2 domain-containing protein n=1 Tax=Melanomma pulvis-pyrius CBS 109.77 TaxID=1314802 RepID=A0A6A6WPU4_9PLEO|nr:hypothetical protein K505DRAFT_260584 [Melanomma pulvis-pyrius CBS 109.77]
MSTTNPLPALKRYITTHSPTGKAIFSTSLPEDNTFNAGRGNVSDAYATQGFPPDLNSDQDIDVYKSILSNPTGIAVPNGSVLRFVDVSPAAFIPLHRTVSLDYGIVISGEVELILDSGESRLLKPGDLAIQRGTMHAWKNGSETEWARMVFVVTDCKPITVNGATLAEDLRSFQAGLASE